MSKNETKRNVTIIEGVITSARVGASRFDDTVKNRLSIKSDSLPYDELEKAYANVGAKLTPTWIKEKNGYINLSSKFNIPVKNEKGKELTFEELTELTTCIGSKVKVGLNIKDGAIYPTAIVIVEAGEEFDPFADMM